MDPEKLVAGLALIGIVIIVSALLSGLVDRSGLPQVAVFIIIGFALGPDSGGQGRRILLNWMRPELQAVVNTVLRPRSSDG